MVVKKLSVDNLSEDFLITLSNLSNIEGLSLEKAGVILDRVLKNPCYNVFVFELDSKIVGCATLLVEQKFIHNGGFVGHIEDVATRKGFEGKGVGSSLIKHLISEAKKLGCYKVILDCSEDNVGFYERFGFKKHEVCIRLHL